ncbi:bacteriocin-type signal sequence-containing protein [Chryseobacterium oleae]|uniref:Bacteriocin-type signal sequence-containing protein n=1 Tax=Chryseobacterium oleae TaxID=491207 RepID=A0A1I4VG84_CHROL|nr:bacteriocin [Chryseobacterium oleae]SFN00103.1 bacteriocin-type signal sequence-containing protein [Chryseobacterium oleae]
MKNSFLQRGKKLSKKELKTIAGGKLDCMEPVLCTDPPCEVFSSDDPRACTKISVGCAQKICRPQ